LRQTWRRLLAGESGLRSLVGRGNGAGEHVGEFDALPSTVAGVVEHGSGPHQFPTDTRTLPRSLSKFMHYATVAADEALADAHWPPPPTSALSAAARERTVRAHARLSSCSLLHTYSLTHAHTHAHTHTRTL
jgi:3-oxoacyl-(acyl-carrier-protein) synthase